MQAPFRAGCYHNPARLRPGMEEKMFEKLVAIICEYVEVEPENVHPESRFMEDLGFTSFDFMSMLGEVEEEFDVEVNQKEAADIRPVQEAVDYLEKLSAQQ